MVEHDGLWNGSGGILIMAVCESWELVINSFGKTEKLSYCTLRGFSKECCEESLFSFIFLRVIQIDISQRSWVVVSATCKIPFRPIWVVRGGVLALRWNTFQIWQLCVDSASILCNKNGYSVGLDCKLPLPFRLPWSSGCFIKLAKGYIGGWFSHVLACNWFRYSPGDSPLLLVLRCPSFWHKDCASSCLCLHVTYW